MAHELRNKKKLPTGNHSHIQRVSRSVPLTFDFWMFFLHNQWAMRDSRRWDHWSSEMLEFTQKPERYFQSCFNIGSKVPPSSGGTRPLGPRQRRREESSRDCHHYSKGCNSKDEPEADTSCSTCEHECISCAWMLSQKRAGSACDMRVTHLRVDSLLRRTWWTGRKVQNKWKTRCLMPLAPGFDDKFQKANYLSIGFTWFQTKSKQRSLRNQVFKGAKDRIFFWRYWSPLWKAWFKDWKQFSPSKCIRRV